MRRSTVASLVALALLLPIPAVVHASVPAVADQAAGAGARRIIVVLADGPGDVLVAATGIGRRHGFRPEQVFRHALRGFTATVPAGALQALRLDPRVRSVELDQPVAAFGQTLPTGVSRINAATNAAIAIDGVDDKRVDADVAVIDTGVDLNNTDLSVMPGVDCRSGSCSAGGNDDNGHGTHVAGIIGALDNGNAVVGVAPGVRIWPVKVLDRRGSGQMSGIIAGVDYVAAHAAEIEVANMSLGCQCASSALDTAISNAVAAGIVFAVAAGNSYMDAKGFTPASNPDVITVSAIADYDGLPGAKAKSTCYADRDDTLAGYSNWGKTVEVAAPGTCILSLAPGGKLATMSGTSMASPHVAGAAALLASVSKPTSKSQALSIRSTIAQKGNTGWTDDSPDGTREPLLDVSTFSPVLK